MKPLHLEEQQFIVENSSIKPSISIKANSRPKTPVSSGENQPVGVKGGMLQGIFNKKAN
jgi:hypothetical protein